jgi:hypothetical protein
MRDKGKVAEAYWRYVEARSEQMVSSTGTGSNGWPKRCCAKL